MCGAVCIVSASAKLAINLVQSEKPCRYADDDDDHFLFVIVPSHLHVVHAIQRRQTLLVAGS